MQSPTWVRLTEMILCRCCTCPASRYLQAPLSMAAVRAFEPAGVSEASRKMLSSTDHSDPIVDRR